MGQVMRTAPPRMRQGFLGIPQPHRPKETVGSPKFPSYPFEYMPRSQTPVVSPTLALSRPGLLPSRLATRRLFPLVARELIP